MIRRIIALVLALPVLLTVGFSPTPAMAKGPTGFSFTGTVVSLPDTPDLTGQWTVGSRTVVVDSATVLDDEHGQPTVGAVVEVKGLPQLDGTIKALKIEVKSVPGGTVPSVTEVTGTITSLPASGLVGEWTVDGKTVRVYSTTTLEGGRCGFAVGGVVEIKGVFAADGILDAVKIELKGCNSQGGVTTKTVEIKGFIVSLPGTPDNTGTWGVGATTFTVTADTVLKTVKGIIAVGAYVQVQALRFPDNSIVAVKIEVKRASMTVGRPARIYGVITALPGTPDNIGDWVVAGRTVHVSAATRIETKKGPIAVGATVEVKGVNLADGSVDASRIDTKKPFGH